MAERVNLFRITKEITRDLRWIYAQSLPDLRVISTGIVRKLGAIPEQIRRKSRTNPAEIAREFSALKIACSSNRYRFVFSSLGLHTLALPKIGFASDEKNK
ncbi:MAG: hypothetical protein IKK07_09640 [Bacteroides sp.]|nr:hypothetical protein [Bacteroides sp.]